MFIFIKKMYLFRQQRWLCVSHLLIVGVSVEHLCREVWKVSRINISFKKYLDVCIYIYTYTLPFRKTVVVLP